MSPSSGQNPRSGSFPETAAQTFTRSCWKPWGPAPSLDGPPCLCPALVGALRMSAHPSVLPLPPELVLAGRRVTEVAGLLLTSPRASAPREAGARHPSS